MIRTATGLLVTAMVLVLVAGCGASPPTPPPSAVTPTSVTAPPSGLPHFTYQPPPTSPADTSCDPRRSASVPDPARAAGDQLDDRGAQSSLTAIRGRGFLRIGVDQDTLLFGYRDPVSGRREGVDVDLGRAISQRIFGDDREPVFRVVANEDRIAAVNQDDRARAAGIPAVDMVIRTMTITCERKRQVAFSTVYFEAKQRVLVRTEDTDPAKPGHMLSSRDLAGRTVCTTRGSNSGDNLYRAGLSPAPRVVNAAQWNDCLVLLQNRAVDAVSTDHTILDGMRADDPRTTILGGDDVSSEPYGIAMNLAATDLVRAVNRALEDIRAGGQWQQIYGTYLPAATYGPVPPPPAAQYCLGGVASC